LLPLQPVDRILGPRAPDHDRLGLWAGAPVEYRLRDGFNFCAVRPMFGRDDDVLARGKRRIGGLGQEEGLEAAGWTKPYGDCARGSIHVESYL
jgi:hypothetical protein